MVVSRTNERQFLRMAMHLAPQAAEGSPITDFTSGTGAMVWARSVRATEGTESDNFQGTSGSIFEHVDGMIDIHRKPEIEIIFYPTPTIITEFLKMNGSVAAGSVIWSVGIPNWYSFLFAEVAVGTAGYRMWRFEDAWVQELEFDTGGFGVAVCKAKILAQKVTEVATNQAGYSADSNPNDSTQFAHRAAELIRDPSGLNVSIAVKQFTLNLRWGFDHEPFNEEWAKITKQGLFEVTGTLMSRFMDETIAIRQDAIADTIRAYRHKLTAGANYIQFDLNNVKWSAPPVGFENRNVIDFNATFRVGTSNFATENSIDITIG